MAADLSPIAVVNRYLPFYSQADWQMAPAERLAIVALLDYLRPECSLEVGTKYGGSLSVLSHYSQHVFSLDIDPTVPERLGPIEKVEFVIGDSRQTLPCVLDRVAREHLALSFALLDGDHSAEGARHDCAAFLSAVPQSTLYLLMHDSFNPGVRAGIKAAGWAACPYVQVIDLDFVPGVMFTDRGLRRKMWGGFALAILSPEPRQGDLRVYGSAEMSFRHDYPFSAHQPVMRALDRVREKSRRLLAGSPLAQASATAADDSPATVHGLHEAPSAAAKRLIP